MTMGFLDEVGKVVSDASQKTIQKTRVMSETVKINSAIVEEEKKIQKMYCQIGTMYVEKYGNNCEEIFWGLVSSILETEEKIKEYQGQLQRIKGVRRCKKCGAEVPLEIAFCNMCGTEMSVGQSNDIDKKQVD